MAEARITDERISKRVQLFFFWFQSGDGWKILGRGGWMVGQLYLVSDNS